MLDNINKILVIRPRFIGDVLLTTTAVHALRVKYPSSYIAYLTEQEAAPLLLHNPDINEVIVIKRTKSIKEFFKITKRIKNEKFDLVIDFLGNPRTAFITFLSKAKYKLGFYFRGRRFCYNIEAGKPKGHPDVIDTYLSALEPIGIESKEDLRKLVLNLNNEELRKARDFLTSSRVSFSSPVVGLFPGASWPAKRWPVEHYARLSNLLIDNERAQLLVFTGPREIELIKELRSRLPKAVWVEEFPIREVAAIIRYCNLFVTNDGGLMHVAVALEVPTLAIFGPGEPDIWFPYKENKYISLHKKSPCWPCHLDFCDKLVCLKNVEVNEVYENSRELLKIRLKNEN